VWLNRSAEPSLCFLAEIPAENENEGDGDLNNVEDIEDAGGVDVACAEPRAVIAADLDADDHLDLVVPCAGDRAVLALRNSDNEVFDKVVLDVEARPFAALVADLGGSCLPDIAVIHAFPMVEADCPDSAEAIAVSLQRGLAELDGPVLSRRRPGGAPELQLDAAGSVGVGLEGPGAAVSGMRTVPLTGAVRLDLGLSALGHRQTLTPVGTAQTAALVGLVGVEGDFARWRRGGLAAGLAVGAGPGLAWGAGLDERDLRAVPAVAATGAVTAHHAGWCGGVRAEAPLIRYVWTIGGGAAAPQAPEAPLRLALFLGARWKVGAPAGTEAP
jgi:hypothetical protein